MTNNPLFKVERMHLLDTEGPTKAFCDLLVADTCVAKGFKVIQGKKGLFVGMPQEKGRDEKWYDTFYTLSPETRTQIQQLILKNYNEHRDKT
ncbi:MAG: septation protein SpoVG family protein [Candidatus Omnitrophota bacterium]